MLTNGLVTQRGESHDFVDSNVTEPFIVLLVF